MPKTDIHTRGDELAESFRNGNRSFVIDEICGTRGPKKMILAIRVFDELNESNSTDSRAFFRLLCARSNVDCNI